MKTGSSDYIGKNKEAKDAGKEGGGEFKNGKERDDGKRKMKK